MTIFIGLARLRQLGRHVAGAALAVAVFLGPVPAQPQAPPGMGETLPPFVDNSLGMRLVLLVPGQVPTADDVRGGGRMVGIDRPIYMGVHELTHGAFQAFIAANRAAGRPEREHDAPRASEPSADPDEPLLGAPGLSPTAPHHPAQFVSWSRAHAFTEWLSAKEGRKYRLPTEEEWEYACRAGATRLPTDATAISEVANIADRAFQKSYPLLVRRIPVDDGHAFAAPVGSYRANGVGLHDMIGNVWEWVAASPSTRERATRTALGGGFASSPERASCAARLEVLPHYRYATTGFRIVLDVLSSLPSPSR